jgi:hypothetical protein
VDQWIDTSGQLVSGPGFDMLCGRLNDYLSMRSFFVGFTTTAADFAIWGQLHGEASLLLVCPHQQMHAARVHGMLVFPVRRAVGIDARYRLILSYMHCHHN